jgi:hypothetical protein
VKRRKLPKHQVYLFFSGNEQLKIMILYVHSDFVTIFMHLSGISKNTNKQKTRKKNVYDGDRKLRFIDRQTTGDKLNETDRQMHKLRNGQMENTNI